jgi:ribosomal-protein-alanine N-acetyltransferase
VFASRQLAQLIMPDRDFQGPTLEYRILTAEWKRPLLAFLNILQEKNETDFFYPHPFTEEALDDILSVAALDCYCVATEGNQVLGYGLLRGWDDGYEVPSLGIAIHPDARRTGLSKGLMNFLHDTARKRGAKKVRLRVKAENVRALALYNSLGYSFPHHEKQYLVGFLDLQPTDRQ